MSVDNLTKRGITSAQIAQAIDYFKRLTGKTITADDDATIMRVLTEQNVINTPAVQQAMQSGYTGEVEAGSGWKVRMVNGKPVAGSSNKGGPWRELLAAGAVIGGGAALSGLGAVAPEVAVSSGTTTGATASTVAGAVAPTTTASAGGGMGLWGSFLKTVAPDLIQGGTQLVGAKMASNASKDAANIESAANDKALALQKEMFDKETALEQGRYNASRNDDRVKYEQGRSDLTQSRADLSPFRQLGAGSLSLLGQGLGFNIDSSALMNGTMASPPASQQASPMASLTLPPAPEAPQMPTSPATAMPVPGTPQQAAQQASQSGYTAMRSPTGKDIRVPAHMVQEALQRGAQMVNA